MQKTRIENEIMSGRGKGGKGLGKGGAKRHRKVLRDNIQGMWKVDGAVVDACIHIYIYVCVCTAQCLDPSSVIHYLQVSQSPQFDVLPAAVV